MSSNTKNRPDSQKKEEKKKEKKVIIIILVIVLSIVIIALLVIIAFLLGQEKAGVSDNASGREVAGSARVVVDQDGATSVVDQMREEVEEGMFECQMSMKWTFDDGSSESKDAYVANSTNNTHPIYFDVFLEGSDEPIYSSPVLPVGTDLTGIKLDEELAAGEYKATVMYTLLSDVETQEEISKAGFVIKINVRN